MSDQLPTDEEQLDLLRRALGIRDPDAEKVVCGSMFGKGQTPEELYAEEMEALHWLGSGGDDGFRAWIRQASRGARG